MRGARHNRVFFQLNAYAEASANDTMGKAKIIPFSGQYDDLTPQDFQTLHTITLAHSLQELFRYCKPRDKEELIKAALEWNYLFNDEYESELPFEVLLADRGIDVEWARGIIRRLLKKARAKKGRLGFNLFIAALKRLGINDHAISNSMQKKRAA
ncbi:MAG: hypothetical protein ACE5GN_06350 [Waddliaceae bacterium]